MAIIMADNFTINLEKSLDDRKGNERFFYK